MHEFIQEKNLTAGNIINLNNDLMDRCIYALNTLKPIRDYYNSKWEIPENSIIVRNTGHGNMIQIEGKYETYDRCGGGTEEHVVVLDVPEGILYPSNGNYEASIDLYAENNQS